MQLRRRCCHIRNKPAATRLRQSVRISVRMECSFMGSCDPKIEQEKSWKVGGTTVRKCPTNFSLSDTAAAIPGITFPVVAGIRSDFDCVYVKVARSPVRYGERERAARISVRGFGLEPQPDQQIIERDPARRRFRQG